MIKPQSERRDPQKRDLGTFLGHLSFWVNGMESTLIFLYKKEKKRKTKYKIHDWIVPFIDWNKLNIWKIENYTTLGPSYKLPNNYMPFCPSYILPKTNKDKTRST